jgi:hypothetical protein
VGGAALGAGYDPLGNRPLSALAGGVAGAALPSIANLAMRAPEKIDLPSIPDKIQPIAEKWAEKVLPPTSYLARRAPVSPNMFSRMLTGGAGAAIGAPIGYNMNQDDPNMGALQGAAVGGLAGSALGGGGIDPIIKLRNAGLLSGLVQLKKPIADVGITVGTALEKLLSGDPALAGRLIKEGFRLPTNFQNYAKGISNPDLLEAALGEVREATPAGVLGTIVRPLTGAMYSTQQIMERAGMPLEEIKDALLTTGMPKTALGKWWLQGQQYPAVRALRPFAKFGTNWMEQGLQRTPGISMMFGPAETRGARTALGAGAVGLGYLEGQREQDEPTSPVASALLKALAGRYGLPFVIGEAMVPGGVNRLIQSLPGVQAALPFSQHADNLIDYLKRLGQSELRSEEHTSELQSR